MAGEIRVVDYDPAWVAVFAQIRARVDASLGDLADAIEHVGSTAVPGLAAKPIIDIDVRLTAHTNLVDAIERLEDIGYHHRGDLGIEGREAFDPPADLPDHHLYVCLPTASEFQRHLAFRDFLRANPHIATEYALLKKRLAVEFRQDRDGYTEAKGPFVEGVLRRSAEAISKQR